MDWWDGSTDKGICHPARCDLSSSPGTHMIEGGTDSWKLSFNFHIPTVACHVHTCTHTNQSKTNYLLSVCKLVCVWMCGGHRVTPKCSPSSQMVAVFIQIFKPLYRQRGWTTGEPVNVLPSLGLRHAEWSYHIRRGSWVVAPLANASDGTRWAMMGLSVSRIIPCGVFLAKSGT